IKEKYRSLGYAHVEVESYTFERRGKQERHVTYVIDERKRVTIGSVVFDGNLSHTESELMDVFDGFAPVLLSHGYYVEKEVEGTAELLIDWLKSRGYLSAKLVTIGRRFDERKNEVHLTVCLYEGEQTVVQIGRASCRE